MPFPPGLVFLSTNIPQIVLPPLLVYVLSYVARTAFGFVLPVWLSAAAYLLSWPVAITLSIQYRDWKIERDAAAAGAVIPPRVETKRLGGLDLVKAISQDFGMHILGYRHWFLMEKYGTTYNFRVLFENRIFTSEPDYIKRILATEFNNYEKGKNFSFQMNALLGTGVFNSDGDMWKFHRGITRPFFNKDRIAHFDIFDRHADAALKLMKARMEQGYPIDWQDLVSRFTLDSATEFLFGQDVRSLSAPLPYPPGTAPAASTGASEAHPANRFAREFLDAQIASAMRSRYTKSWPLWEFWRDRAAGHMKTIDEFIEPLCREALRRKAEKGAGQAGKAEEVGEEETLLEHLVKLTDDPRIIRDETLNILLAGRDTTAITLTMAGYVLSEHPDILQKLREEILEKVGTRRPTYDDIRDMKYLRAFINEVLRLYPAVPFNVRYSINATTWPSSTPGGKPFYIPAGVRCLYSVYIMHRRKDLWGPDADKFDPDRFIDERLHRYLTPNPFIFVPFNAGPRICLGQQFAYNEASFMLIRLLQRVSRIELKQEANPSAVPPPGWAESPGTDGKDRILFKNHLTLYVQGGLWVKMDGEAVEDV